MTQEVPRRIELREIEKDPTHLTSMYILQIIGGFDRLPISQLAGIVVEQLKKPQQKLLRFSYSPYNSLGELLSGMSTSGLVKKQGLDEDTVVELTSHGRRLVTLLPPGIPEALGFRSPEPNSQA